MDKSFRSWCVSRVLSELELYSFSVIKFISGDESRNTTYWMKIDSSFLNFDTHLTVKSRSKWGLKFDVSRDSKNFYRYDKLPVQVARDTGATLFNCNYSPVQDTAVKRNNIISCVATGRFHGDKDSFALRKLSSQSPWTVGIVSR